jgi:membrane protease YdiL (CAAX protease family)
MKRLAPARGGAPTLAHRLARPLRRYPFAGYVLMAFGWTWTYELTLYRSLLAPGYSLGAALRDLGFALGPALAAICMTAITQGRGGILSFLRRCIRWRVGLRWYMVVLLGVPAMLLLAALLLPGAFSALRLPGSSFWLSYPAWYMVYLVGGPLGEEPGWRGFALPHLERRAGPLMGTFLLGALWSVWHLPLFLIPGTDQYAISLGTGLAGHLSGFAMFALWVGALAIIFTWIFNNTYGSLLLAMLLHASINAAPGVLLPALFPSLADFGSTWVLVWVAVALLVLAATRGRLSNQSYELTQHETELLAPIVARDQ